MDDRQILEQVKQLVSAEHSLRRQVEDGEAPTDGERAELSRLEESLDQCWDLLRQRRALREAGEDPDGAQVRPVSEVEGYRQ